MERNGMMVSKAFLEESMPEPSCKRGRKKEKVGQNGIPGTGTQQDIRCQEVVDFCFKETPFPSAMWRMDLKRRKLTVQLLQWCR